MNKEAHKRAKRMLAEIFGSGKYKEMESLFPNGLPRKSPADRNAEKVSWWILEAGAGNVRSVNGTYRQAKKTAEEWDEGQSIGGSGEGVSKIYSIEQWLEKIKY